MHDRWFHCLQCRHSLCYLHWSTFAELNLFLIGDKGAAGAVAEEHTPATPFQAAAAETAKVCALQALCRITSLSECRQA